MIPEINLTSYSDFLGEKWAKKLGVDQIDISHIGSDNIK